MIEIEPRYKKPRLRVFPDGKVIRFWHGAFGATFPTGPHKSVKDALSYKTYFLALQAVGLSAEAAKDREWRNDRQ